jgi:hypothetical protein
MPRLRRAWPASACSIPACSRLAIWPDNIRRPGGWRRLATSNYSLRYPVLCGDRGSSAGAEFVYIGGSVCGYQDLREELTAR